MEVFIVYEQEEYTDNDELNLPMIAGVFSTLDAANKKAKQLTEVEGITFYATPDGYHTYYDHPGSAPSDTNIVIVQQTVDKECE